MSRRPFRKPPFEKPAGLQARFVAARAVDDLLRHRTPLGEALDKALHDISAAGLDTRDQGLARAIATVTLRRHGTISQALAARLPKGFPENAGRFEAILRTAAAQLLFLDLPVYAVVDLAVTLVSGDKFGSRYAPVANAVLRKIAAERAAIRTAAEPLRTDTPGWLAARWIAAYGGDTAQAIAAAHQAEPPLDLTVKSDPAGWAARLGGVALANGSVRLADAGAVTALEGYGDGGWWVQDAAASLPARLIAAKPGMTVLDLCAAPGGKTAQLAAAGAAVTAVDKSAGRLRRLTENLARLNLTAQVVAADAATYVGGPFDAVLLDAPCSATGTLRRHPDVGWLKGETDIMSLAALQSRLLDRAVDLVMPGGTLVFCTCSLEPAEGEDQITALLARRADLIPVPVDPAEIGGQESAVTSQGYLRTRPDIDPLDAQGQPVAGGQDGFFVARLRRL